MVRGVCFGKASKTLTCRLPEYHKDSKTWRQNILRCAREAADSATDTWDSEGPFEVVALLYMQGGRDEKHDVDNLLKDVLDGLQGAFFSKAEGKRRDISRVIRNDRSVPAHRRREAALTQEVPRTTPTLREADLLIRPYKKNRWRSIQKARDQE